MSEDDKGPKVIDFQAKPDELKGAVDSLMRNLPTLIELAAVKAVYKRQYYLMLCQQGFTSEQAIELAKDSSPLCRSPRTHTLCGVSIGLDRIA